MKNNFAEEYKVYLKVKNDYNLAEKAGDEKGKNDAREKYNRIMESIQQKGNMYAKVYSLYSEAQERGNEYLDLHEVIWDGDVEELINCFRKYGIEKFTFSSRWSSAVEVAWLFIENRCSLEGIKEINGHWDDLNGGFKKMPAYIFRV